MTWVELKKEAKKMGACVLAGVIFLNGNSYRKINKECIIRDKNKADSVSVFVESYDKMLLIMRGLS